MNISRTLLVSSLVLLASASTFAAPRRATAPTVTTLSPSAMAFAIEEERVAQDIYSLAAQRWNLAIFSNISRSETQHAAALAQVALRFNLPVPAASVGTYQTSELQALYDHLASLVAVSADSALSVGALIEETDIADLREAASTITDPTTRAVMARLEAASWQHLAAFVRNLQLRGVTYEPQILSAAEFAARIN